jgi:tetratricopeptide (TPR) repeat protein
MLREASDIIRRLLQDQPAVSQFRYTLAAIQTNIGTGLTNTGHLDQALAAYGEALAIERRLIEDNPTVTDFRYFMAGCLGLIADTKSVTGHSAEAVTDYREVLTTLRKLKEDHPTVLKFELTRVDFHLKLSMALAGISEYAAATEECRQAVAIMQQLPPEAFFLCGLACAQSQLAGSLVRERSGKAREAEAMAQAAVATLRRAIDAGYRDLQNLKMSQALNPIRSRADFQLLWSDLIFPADVFAR